MFGFQEKDTKHRPLIFIGHSFGGIVIEQVR
jgi:surfactin synthase thioesterase subunit